MTDKPIKDTDQRNVPWVVFIWVIALLSSAISYSVLNSVSAKSVSAETKTKYDTDIVWIRETLSEIKDKQK